MAERQEGKKNIPMNYKAVETMDEQPETVDEDESLEGLPGTVDEDDERDRTQRRIKDSSATGFGCEAGRDAGKRTEKKEETGRQEYYRNVLRGLVPWLAAFLVLLAVTQGIAGAVRIGQEARRAELSQLYGVRYEWK